MAVQRPLHVLSVSPPHLNGYAVRTHALLRAQVEAGLAPVGITSPYYPLACLNTPEPFSIDGITYHRVPNPRFRAAPGDTTDPNALSVGETLADRSAYWYVPRFVFQLITAARSLPQARCTFYPRLVELARRENCDLIHAHTPFRNGFPSLWTARKLGVPFVYEMRGLWEDTAVEGGKFKEGSPIYRGFRFMETAIVKRADAVLTITQALACDIARRGVPEEKIFVVPNGAAASLTEQLRATENIELVREIRARLGATPETPVLGYVGSLRKLEGIHFLVDAFGALLARVPSARLLIVGGGDQDYADALQQRLAAQGLADRALFHGPIPNKQIASAYSIIDVLAITRLPSRVTSLVSPLKPFEAMALGKAVLLPDLPAMSEIITPGETGWLFRSGDPADFVEQAARLLLDAPLCERLGAAAAQAIVREKSWGHSVEATKRAYAFACNSPRIKHRK
ncbi:MAG: hypothetical protein PWP23_406 [Candidatus Sumerlaeota bacterium]|nr:hypothetical protein [Candidatus Sumerlaeota bacterium]